MTPFVVLVLDVRSGEQTHPDELAEFCSEADFLDKLLYSGMAYILEYVSGQPHTAELMIY